MPVAAVVLSSSLAGEVGVQTLCARTKQRLFRGERRHFAGSVESSQRCGAAASAASAFSPRFYSLEVEPIMRIAQTRLRAHGTRLLLVAPC